MKVSSRLTEEIETCRNGADRLLERLLDELAQPGCHASRVVELKSVNGVVQATVTTVEKYRWDSVATR